MATNGSTMEALAVAAAVPAGPGPTNQDGARGGASNNNENDENDENTNVMRTTGGQQHSNDDDDDDNNNNVPMATSAVPVFPPRPDAFVTLLTTEDHLPGAQTMLYSLKVRSAFHFRCACPVVFAFVVACGGMAHARGISSFGIHFRPFQPLFVLVLINAVHQPTNQLTAPTPTPLPSNRSTV